MNRLPTYPNFILVSLCAFLLTLTACENNTTSTSTRTESHKATPVELNDTQINNIVRRSYQYVAMYNVIQKFALNPSAGGIFLDGFNNPVAKTVLIDHTMRSIARPNNDTLYQGAVLDLRADAVIVEFPAIDSKYVVLQISGYDHYTGVPLATTNGDFKNPTKILFYTNRTENYNGEEIDGVDQVVKVDGDFTVAFLRAMPHQADPARMQQIIAALESVNVVTLSEFQGQPARKTTKANFPDFGESDEEVFANNLLEVMQFVFNHTSFDPDDPMDQALLSAYKSLGVEPNKPFDAAKVAKIDAAKFASISKEVAVKALTDMTDSEVLNAVTPKMFMPKGAIDLRTQVIQSVVGPIGLPAYQARYLPVPTEDGKPMNAQNDYVMTISKEDLPPAKAFWSLTLYDLENGFFIPNDQKKYSVGENAGFVLNESGGIDIHISESKPEGVPGENWLPINRGDLDVNVMFRVYAPDAEKMKVWKMPKPKVL